jgi:hypothetical protein
VSAGSTKAVDPAMRAMRLINVSMSDCVIEGRIMQSTDGGNIPAVEFQYTKDDFYAAYQLGCSLTRRGLLFCILLTLLICIGEFLLFHEANEGGFPLV